MIQISPGDLVAIAAGERHFYALVIERIALFGGQWSFAFHRTSPRQDLLDAEELMVPGAPGFHAYVDFIHAKREGRATRVARGLDTAAFRGPGFRKSTHWTEAQRKAGFWFIEDAEGNDLGRVGELTPEQRAYPLTARIDDVLMVERIDAGWRPEHDVRIDGPQPPPWWRRLLGGGR